MVINSRGDNKIWTRVPDVLNRFLYTEFFSPLFICTSLIDSHCEGFFVNCPFRSKNKLFPLHL